MSMLRRSVLQLAWPVLVFAGGITAYDRCVLRPALRIGVVDVAEVYRQKEGEFAASLTTAATDSDRRQAMELARRFAQRLPAALDELPRDCECLVVLRSAVAAADPHRTIDLTARLKAKVGTP